MANWRVCLAAIWIMVAPSAAWADDGYRLVHSFTQYDLNQGGYAYFPTAPIGYQAPGRPDTWALYGAASYACTDASGDITCSTMLYKLTPPVVGSTHWTERRLALNVEIRAPFVFDTVGSILGVQPSIGNSRDGYQFGSIWRITPPGLGGYFWSQRQVIQFGSGSDGCNPTSTLLADGHGGFFGTTTNSFYNPDNPFSGPTCPGSIYHITPPATASGSWSRTTLYRGPQAADGFEPNLDVFVDAAGALIGTAHAGGAAILYRLSPPSGSGTSWIYTVLANFVNYTPIGTSTHDASGAVYGVGFRPDARRVAYRASVQADGTWRVTTLYSFGSGSDINLGALNADGSLSGWQYTSPPHAHPVQFKLAPPTPPAKTWTYTILRSLDPDRPQPDPTGPRDASGALYGSVQSGGVFNGGYVYKILP